MPVRQFWHDVILPRFRSFSAHVTTQNETTTLVGVERNITLPSCGCHAPQAQWPPPPDANKEESETRHMNKKFTIALGCLTALTGTPAAYAGDTGYDDPLIDAARNVTLGPRPLFLVNDMSEETSRERELKSRLMNCAAEQRDWQPSELSISHRGAPLQFPEHTLEAYLAGAQGGAGIIECDVTFTSDHELVCRHSQCDLHYTTNIVETDLAEKCSVPPEFDPDSGELVNAADIQCCTSDITLAEFRTRPDPRYRSHPDRAPAEALLELLRDQRIEVQRAARPFRADARPHDGFAARREFPVGTLRVPARQTRGRTS